MALQPVLIAGEWQAARATGTFFAENPASGAILPDEYPTSDWQDCTAVLQAAAEASRQLRSAPPEQIAQFLENYAGRLEARGRRNRGPGE